MTGVKHEAVNKVYLENMTSTDGRDSEAWLHLIIYIKSMYRAINLY